MILICKITLQVSFVVRLLLQRRLGRHVKRRRQLPRLAEKAKEQREMPPPMMVSHQMGPAVLQAGRQAAGARAMRWAVAR